MVCREQAFTQIKFTYRFSLKEFCYLKKRKNIFVIKTENQEQGSQVLDSSFSCPKFSVPL